MCRLMWKVFYISIQLVVTSILFFPSQSFASAPTCKVFVPISVGDIYFPIPIWPDGPNSPLATTPISNITPIDGTVTNQAAQTISGCVGEDITNLSIGGEMVPINTNKSFSYSKVLTTQWNSIDLIAANFNHIVPLGNKFRANVNLSGAQKNPQVIALDNGGFVIIWSIDIYNSNGNYTRSDVYGQTYSSAGNPLGNEFYLGWTVREPNFRNNYISKINDGFIVALYPYHVNWKTYYNDGTYRGLEMSKNAAEPSITILNSGLPVIVYAVNPNPYVGNWDIKGTALDSLGNPLFNEFDVNTNDGEQFYPIISGLSDGGFIVGWTGVWPTQNASLQRFHGYGGKNGGEIIVNEYSSIFQDIVGLENSGFVVAWDQKIKVYNKENQPVNTYNVNIEYVNLLQATNGYLMSGRKIGTDDIIGRFADLNGSLIGGDISIDPYSDVSGSYTSTTTLNNGNIVFVWEDNGFNLGDPDGGIAARIYSGVQSTKQNLNIYLQ